MAAAKRGQLFTAAVAVGLMGRACSQPASVPEHVLESPVETHSAAEKPTLTLIERSGDVRPAAAIAVAHHATRDAAGRVSERVLQALTAQGLRPVLDTTQTGFVVSFDVSGPAAAAAYPALRAALATPEGASSRPLAEPLAPFDACTPAGESEAETLSPGWKNVALAAVGPSAFVREWQSALQHDGGWPEGDSPLRSWPTEPTFLRQERPGATTLWVAVWTQAREKLLEAGAQLGHSQSRLRKSLRALGALSLREVTASSRPGGGCIAVALDAEPGAEDAKLGRGARIADEAIRDALRTAAPRAPVESALMATDARQAARLGAWHALSDRTAHAPDHSGETAEPILVLRTSDSSRQLAQVIEAWNAASESVAEVHTRVELGQGRLWLLLSHDCPLLGEDQFSAGYTTLALDALRHSSTEGTQFYVYLGPSGPALLASGRALQPGDLERFMRDLQAALFSVLLEETPILLSKDRALAEMHSDPLLWLGARVLTGGRPSELLVRGTPESLASARPAVVRRRLRAFLSGPLTPYVLANASEDQGDYIASALATALRPFRGSPLACPASVPNPTSGFVALAEPDPDRTGSALLVYPVPGAALEAADALGQRLETTYLPAALGALPGLHQAEVAALGSRQGQAALVIAVHTDGDVAPVIAQTRALIARLKQEGLGDAAPRAPLSAPGLPAPVQRLVRWAYGDAPASHEAIGALLAEAFADDSVLVVTAAD